MPRRGTLAGAVRADPASVAALKTVTVAVQDRPDGDLWTSPGVITLDTNAAGYGWFLDSSPADNSEFAPGAASPAQRHADPLSVIAHELGHELGLYLDDAGDDVMNEFLAVGVRYIPEPTAAPVIATPATATAPSVVPGLAIQPAAAPSVGASAAQVVVTGSTIGAAVESTTSTHSSPPIAKRRFHWFPHQLFSHTQAGSKHSVMIHAGHHEQQRHALPSAKTLDHLKSESTLDELALNLLRGESGGPTASPEKPIAPRSAVFDCEGLCLPTVIGRDSVSRGGQRRTPNSLSNRPHPRSDSPARTSISSRGLHECSGRGRASPRMLD